MYPFPLTFSTLQSKTNVYANNVDPDEMAHNEQSHQDLHLPLDSQFLTGISMWNNGWVQIQRWKSPL